MTKGLKPLRCALPELLENEVVIIYVKSLETTGDTNMDKGNVGNNSSNINTLYDTIGLEHE